MKQKGDNWLNIVQQWLMPPRCLLCDGPGQSAPLLDICATCQADLPGIGHGIRLGSPVDSTGPLHPAIDQVFAPYRYEFPLDSLIPALKYRAGFCVARVFGGLLACALATNTGKQESGQDLPWPEALLPVPLHANRLRSRGFNQAYEIAKPVSRYLGIPIDAGVCRRVIDTPPQTGLGAGERQRNLHDAFCSRKCGLPKSLAIIDDVVTTGSTVQAIAMVLKKQGVESVQVWSVARTL
jgi:ComF family protein